MAGFDAAAMGLRKSTKHAPLPGTSDGPVGRNCPACLHGELVRVRPCCGSPKGKVQCPRCGYREEPK